MSSKIIVFAHTKGGVGKSTLAWHTAYALKALGEEISILDLDFQRTLFFINEIREANELDTLPIHQIIDEEILVNMLEAYEGTLIIDVGGFDSSLNRIAMSYADIIVVPISNAITEVIGFKTFEAILEETGLDNVKVLLNNIHPSTKNFSDIEEAVSSVEHIQLLESVICRRKIYDSAMHFGQHILESADKKAIKEIEDLANELNRL